MYISISHSGIDRHIAILEEEKKQVHLLRETLRQVESLNMYDASFNCSVVRECLDSVGMLEKNIKWRADFLNDLNESTRALEKKTKEMLEELRSDNNG